MTRVAHQDDPIADERDFKRLSTILNRAKANRKRPKSINDEFMHHAKSMLRIMLEDDTFACVSPEVLAERKQLAEEKRAKKLRSAALEEEVRRREAVLETPGHRGTGAPEEDPEAGGWRPEALTAQEREGRESFERSDESSPHVVNGEAREARDA